MFIACVGRFAEYWPFTAQFHVREYSRSFVRLPAGTFKDIHRSSGVRGVHAAV